MRQRRRRTLPQYTVSLTAALLRSAPATRDVDSGPHLYSRSNCTLPPLVRLSAPSRLSHIARVGGGPAGITCAPAPCTYNNPKKSRSRCLICHPLYVLVW